jgi:hypothetical protein
MSRVQGVVGNWRLPSPRVTLVIIFSLSGTVAAGPAVTWTWSFLCVCVCAYCTLSFLCFRVRLSPACLMSRYLSHNLCLHGVSLLYTVDSPAEERPQTFCYVWKSGIENNRPTGGKQKKNGGAERICAGAPMEIIIPKMTFTRTTMRWYGGTAERWNGTKQSERVVRKITQRTIETNPLCIEMDDKNWIP